jgi:hypothetical protein
MMAGDVSQSEKCRNFRSSSGACSRAAPNTVPSISCMPSSPRRLNYKIRRIPADHSVRERLSRGEIAIVRRNANKSSQADVGLRLIGARFDFSASNAYAFSKDEGFAKQAPKPISRQAQLPSSSASRRMKRAHQARAELIEGAGASVKSVVGNLDHQREAAAMVIVQRTPSLG